MQDENIETWHILFPDNELAEFLRENNFVERYGSKFIWRNKSYAHSAQQNYFLSGIQQAHYLGIKYAMFQYFHLA
jgi:predicted N-acyltransferase